MDDWVEMPSIFPEIKVWGLVRIPFQYVVSQDTDINRYFVSVKEYPNASKRIGLGEFDTFGEAVIACNNHYEKAIQ